MSRIVAISLVLLSGILILFSSCDKHCSSCSPAQVCAKGTCVCPVPGYEGDSCSTLMSTKFIGNYIVTESCSNNSGLPPNPTYNISIVQDPQGAQYIDIYNLGNTGLSIVGVVTNGIDLQIPDQTVGASEFVGQATFNLAYDYMSLQYQLSANGVAFNCTNVHCQHQ